MGYTTYFSGEFTITPALPDELIEQLNEFCDTRHEGERASVSMGGELDKWNRPYTGPLKDATFEIWCNWKFENDPDPEVDATIMAWNESEKAYSMADWAAFILEHHIPAGHTVEGEIYAEGEDSEDRWRIVMHEGTLHVQTPTITWPPFVVPRECPGEESPDGAHAHNDRGVCGYCGKYNETFDTASADAGVLA